METLPKQYSIPRSIALSLLPGAGITLLYVPFALLMRELGFPSLLAFLLAALVGVILFELGYLLVSAKRATGFYSLKSVIDYRDPAPVWQYFVFPLLFIVWAFVISGISSQMEATVGNRAFSWLPVWFSVTDSGQLAQYSRQVLLLTFMIGLLVNGLVAPTIEELYFRGHLLPRISRIGRWAPLVNVLLFSLYHFWTPWQFASRVLLMLPLAYFARWKRSVGLPIVAHSAVNIVGWILTFGLILSQQ